MARAEQHAHLQRPRHGRPLRRQTEDHRPERLDRPLEDLHLAGSGCDQHGLHIDLRSDDYDRRPAAGARGNADDRPGRRGVQAVLLELRKALSAGRQRRPTRQKAMSRAGARTAAAPIRFCRNCPSVTSSPTSTRSKAASRTAGWAGSIWRSTRTSTTVPSSSRVWCIRVTPRPRRSRWPSASSSPR